MKNRIITSIYFIISGGLVSIGPQYIFKVCESMGAGKIMKCFWTARAEIGVGAVIILSGILLFAVKSAQTRLGVSISIGFAGILSALIPIVLIGVCGMPTMQCRMVTLPAILVLSILIVLISIINAIYLYKLGKRDKEAL